MGHTELQRHVDMLNSELLHSIVLLRLTPLLRRILVLVASCHERLRTPALDKSFVQEVPGVQHAVHHCLVL